MVAENDITQIKSGTAAKVLVKSTGQSLAGKVAEVSLSARNTGGQFLVKVNLEKTPANVLSGMFVNVQFPVAEAKKLLRRPPRWYQKVLWLATGNSLESTPLVREILPF
jgi:hypothetical protein